MWFSFPKQFSPPRLFKERGKFNDSLPKKPKPPFLAKEEWLGFIFYRYFLRKSLIY
jgi:hypothetical protein